MAMTKIPDIAFDIDGEIINLEQDAGCGEVNRIQLHRIHLQHFAGKLGVKCLDVTASSIQRQLKTVHAHLVDLLYDESVREGLIEGDCLDVLLKFDAVETLAAEFLNDIMAMTVGEIPTVADSATVAKTATVPIGASVKTKGREAPFLR